MPLVPGIADEDLMEPEGLPAFDAPPLAFDRYTKVWLHNAAWIALCLAILASALLFSLHMLAKI